MRAKNPRLWTRLIITTSLLILSITSLSVWFYYRPEPHYLSLNIQNPSHTSLEKDAKPKPLAVYFSGSAAAIEKIGKVITKGVQVTPPVDGTWEWRSDSELIFTPKADWMVGVSYKAQLDRSILNPKTSLKNSEFSFNSPEFEPWVKSGEFYEDPTNPKNKQCVVTLSFSHPVDKSSLERHISMKMRVDPIKSFTDSEARPLQFKVSYNENASEAYIRSEVIPIPDRDGEILLTVSEGVVSARGGSPSNEELTRTVQVPGIESYFKVTNAVATTVTNEKTYRAERIISVESSASVTLEELSKNTEAYLLSNDADLYRGLPNLESSETSDEEESGESEVVMDSTDSINPPTCKLTTAGQVTSNILSKSDRLSIKWIPNQTPHSVVNSFTFDAPEGRCILIKIKKGTKSFSDHALVTDRAFLLETKAFTPDIRIIGRGSILSPSGEKKLSIMTRNIDAISIKLFRILPNSLHHLTTQTESFYPFSEPEFNYNFGPEQIAEVFITVSNIPFDLPGKPRYTTFDFNPYINSNPPNPRGLFILEVSGWDPVTKSHKGPKSKRLVLLTDLGFLVKETQLGERHLFVTSIKDGGGIAGATIDVLGKNGVAIFSGTTDENGHTVIPSLTNFKFEKEPTVFVVQKGPDLSFMPFDRRDRTLNFSRFDVGGLYTIKGDESLQAYLFSDRGIYRPGETANLGAIVKRINWEPLPDSLPLELSITDPKGREVKKEPVRLTSHGFIEFLFPVSEKALTGTYQVTLSIVRPEKSKRILSSTSVRVDEFLPDRLKIEAKFTNTDTNFWLKPEEAKARVTLRNLFGPPAIGNTIRGSIKLTPSLPPIREYGDYTFTDPYKAKQSFNESVGDVITDEKGEAFFDLDISRFEKGIYQLLFVGEGFEKEGGRSVIATSSTIINPLGYLVGYSTDGDSSFIKRDSKVGFNLLSIDSTLKRTSVSDLTLEIFETKYVSVLTKLENGSLAYRSVEKKTSIKKETITIPESGLKLYFPTAEPGNFTFILKDKSDITLAEIPFTVVGNANITRDLERNAEIRIKLDKKDYLPGEDITIQIQAPYIGTGLITIERDKVYSHTWFKSDTTASTQKITVPQGLEGNGYVNVTFIRSLGSEEIFMSPVSYGVESFAISRARHSEPLVISAPETVSPGETLKISISSKTPSRTIVYAVDEGILLVSRYKRPDPIGHFHRKRALEVATTQIIDMILPEFNVINKLSSSGGDDDAMLGRQRNPFKRRGQQPVVFWSGLMETDSNPKDISIALPDYFNGSVKVFAVSVTNNGVGVAEESVTVQGNIVLNPNVPMAASPGDEFEISTLVHNIKSEIPEMTISAITDPYISLVGLRETKILLDKGKDTIVSFRAKVNDKLGMSKIIFSATNGDKSIKHTLELSVRPATPITTTVQNGFLSPGLLNERYVTAPLSRTMHSEHSEQTITTSTLPISLATGLATYLERYPNGCSEQVASQAYPSLVYLDRGDLGIDRLTAEKSIEKAITTLASRQTEDGSFKMWPSGDPGDPYLSVHIIRFLIEAKKRGIYVHESLYGNSISFLKTLANRATLTLDDARANSYAIFVLTLDGHITSSYLQAIHGALNRFKDLSWRSDVTALFLAASYHMLQMTDEGMDLWQTVPAYSKSMSINHYQDVLSHAAHYLLITSRFFPQRLGDINHDFIKSIVSDLSANRFNTISSSLLILALSEYQKNLPLNIQPTVNVSATTHNNNVLPIALTQGYLSQGKIPFGTKELRLQTSDTETAPIFFSITETGFDKEISQDITKGLEVFREFLNEKGEVISEARLGDDISVRVLIRGIENPESIGDIVITDMFPAGLQLHDGSLSLSRSIGTPSSGVWYPYYVEAREDRALLYGTIDKSIREYRYKAKAVSRGTFIIPPIQAESMYNQEIFSKTSYGTFLIN